MYEKWIAASWTDIAMVLVTSIVVYVAIVFYTRVIGLRSFSKMSAADFAMTVAVGSLFGATISSPSPTLFVGLFALAMLFIGQWLFSCLRHRVPTISNLIDNKPLLLMAGSQFIDENLRRAKVTRSDVFAKLREANACNYDQVLAVVFETTGDISVLHASDSETKLHPDFLSGVIDGERVA